ncbi:MAG TPA: translocation/assembly module TamB [Balneolales bacterium]|nr:translocation/assembly module TamB [Balneolales bacterium]
MSEEEPTYNTFISWLKSRSKWWYVLLSFLVLLGVLRLSMRSQYVLNYLKSKIESTANKSLQGRLEIGSLKGDLWDGITASNINVIAKDTLLRLDTLHISYNFIQLIKAPHTIQKISLNGLQANVVQEADRSWNILNLLPQDTTAQTSSKGNIPVTCDHVVMRNSSLGVFAPKMIPDSTVRIDQISMNSAFKLKKAGYQFDLNNLSLNIHYRSLENPVTIKTSGKADENSYNLEQLLIATGQTVIRAGGNFKRDSAGTAYQFNLTGNPISWKNVKAIMKSYPVAEDAKVTLSLEGDYEDTGLNIHITSNYLGNLKVESHFKIKPTAALTGLEISADRVNLAGLMKNPQYPRFQNARLALKGTVPLENYQDAQFKGRAEINDFKMAPYQLKRAEMNIQAQKDSVRLVLNAEQGREKVHLNGDLVSPWSEDPNWQVQATARNINPAYWLADSSQTGDLNVNVDASGKGFKPGKAPWKLQAHILKSRYRNIPVSKGNLQANMTDQLISSKSTLNISQSRLNLDFDSHWSLKKPTYTFDLKTHKLNLVELGSMDKYPTALNINVKGSGKNFSLKGIELKAHLNADSSVVNNEFISKMNADVSVQDSILHLKNAVLKSSIADGSFKARQDIYHYDDPQNKLEYDLSIKNIQSLAPLFGVKTLQTKGDLLGDIKMKDQKPTFIADLYLHDIRYDTLGINKVKGQMEVKLTKNPDYQAYLELTEPRVGTLQLQDFTLHSSGAIKDSTALGGYAININIRNKTGSDQKGQYFYSPDSIAVSVDSLMCRTTRHKLKLTKPGRIYYANNTLRTDTLQLDDGDNTLFRFYIAKINNKVQDGFFDARNLNFGAIQNIFLQNSKYGGLVSGHADFDIVNKKVSLHSNLSFADLSYEDVKMDSVSMNMNIDNGQLKANGFVEDKGNKLLVAEANLPFRLGNPTSFDTTFFSNPISGYLRMKPVKLTEYKDLLNKLGWKNASGEIQFNGKLTGEAGSPQITGEFSLSNTEFSKVSIDTAGVNFQYNQSQKQLAFHGQLVSLKQTAAEIKGSIPFSLDLKQFNVELPQKTDAINATITTNNFNLAALNEFVNPEQMNQLQGMMNGQIKVSGTIGKPIMNGDMKLTNGAVGITPAGIDLKKISANMEFEPNKIVLKEFNVKSGGSFKATGDITLNGFETRKLNLKMTADHFRIMDTRNYKGAVSLNTDLTGSLMHPKLKGELTVDNGTVYLDNFGTKSVETVQLNQKKSYSDISLYDSLEVDMNLSINRNFWLRNRNSPEMAFELNGKVDISKKAGKDMKMFGTFNSNQGYATQFGKRFELQKGQITFSGDPTNPSLDIKTLYQLRQPNDISIYYLITGTVNEPKFNYDSDPKMDLKNIISYTLFGRPFNALLSWEQSFSGGGGASGRQIAQSALMNLLIDRVESLATNKLGIDLIQIDNSNQASGNGTTIKAGKYITNKIFLAVLQQLGGNNPVSQVILEYYLRKNLELILTQSENSRTGIDVLWKYDY